MDHGVKVCMLHDVWSLLPTSSRRKGCYRGRRGRSQYTIRKRKRRKVLTVIYRGVCGCPGVQVLEPCQDIQVSGEETHELIGRITGVFHPLISSRLIGHQRNIHFQRKEIKGIRPKVFQVCEIGDRTDLTIQYRLVGFYTASVTRRLQVRFCFIHS